MTGAFCARTLFAGTLVAAVALPLTLPGQTPASPQTPAPVHEAPGAIYQDALHPLEVVRASTDNWSEPEFAALVASMERAREACNAAQPEDYQGEDLYDLAHLCAFGQDWSPANEAAQKYMASKVQAHETQAMAISVTALAHIDATDLALNTTYGLVHFPYDADVAFRVRDPLQSPSYFETASAALSITSATCLGCDT